MDRLAKLRMNSLTGQVSHDADILQLVEMIRQYHPRRGENSISFYRMHSWKERGRPFRGKVVHVNPLYVDRGLKMSLNVNEMWACAGGKNNLAGYPSAQCIG